VIVPPLTAHIQLKETSSLPAVWHNESAFTILRLQSGAGLQEPITHVSGIPALLVSISIKPLESELYRLWIDDKLMPTPFIPAFRANVIDCDAQPGCWAGGEFEYVHYHVPRETIDDVAQDSGYLSVGSFRPVIVGEDLVLAQLTKSILPLIGRPERAGTLALEHLEQVLAAHLLQRYGEMNRPRPIAKGGLANWQKRRALELLRENLDRSLRLSDLARECGLSVSHFSRAFKTSFGMPSHRWLTRLRIEHAKELLAQTREPLIEVATRSGFSDQSAFTRTFQRVVGVSPGRWRRDHSR
jgi:AraC-like DNA-binding protein